MIENLKCPNCTGPLDINDANGNTIVCPWCGNKLLLSGLMQEATQKAETQKNEAEDAAVQIQYYAPRISVEDFEQACQNLFDNNPLLPDDIFKEVNFQELKKVYLPTWVFRGKATGRITWKRDNKYEVRLVDDYFETYTLANRSDVVPPVLKEQLDAFKLQTSQVCKVMYSDEFEGEYLPKVGFEVDFTFANFNNQRRLFRECLNRQYVEANTTASDKEIFVGINYKFDEEIDEHADLEFVPFYIIGFKYKGDTYHIACDAVEGATIVYKLPEDEQRKKALNTLSMSMGYVWAIVVIMMGPPLLWLFGPLKFTTLLWLAIPAFVLVGILGLVGASVAEAKRKKIIEDAKKARKQ